MSDHMTESEVLQDFECDYEHKEKDDYLAKVESMKQRYIDNKRARTGATISCACCASKIVKGHYQTQFCRNRGQANCKDRYWNNTNVKRRLRAQTINM